MRDKPHFYIPTVLLLYKAYPLPSPHYEILIGFGRHYLTIYKTNYVSVQAFPPCMLNFLSLPKNMTRMRTTFPALLHRPANPNHLSSHISSNLSRRLQLYPVENPTFPCALMTSTTMLRTLKLRGSSFKLFLSVMHIANTKMAKQVSGDNIIFSTIVFFFSFFIPPLFSDASSC
uniref:Uncharacterized protein n=1 Tax=Opuntia streptacantha TaxID=393608 RepID=A0A7C9D9I4_OPUST